MSNKFTSLPTMIPADRYPYIFHLDHNANATILADLVKDEQARLYNNRYDNAYSNYVRNNQILTAQPFITEVYNVNGVEVTIKGSEPSVRSVMDVLKTYPPTGPTYNTDYGEPNYKLKCNADCKCVKCYNRYYGLSDIINPDPSTSNKNVPEVGIKKIDDEHSIIITDGENFSGSGFIFFLIKAGIPINISNPTSITALKNNSDKVYIPIFRDTKTKDYNLLGGRISTTDPNKINKNIVYSNAIKEAREESADSIIIVPDSEKTDSKRLYVDIDSKDNKDNTKYRSYLTLGYINDLIELKNIYESNLPYILRNSRNIYDESYRETDGITFLRLDSIIKTINLNKTAMSHNISALSSINFQDVNGNSIRVGGRTVKVFAKILLDNNMDKVLQKIDVKRVTVNNTSSPYNITV
jgi:hypothetical protein